jgi:hypothetical protein
MRYTVNGSEYLMDRALGIYNDNHGLPMKVMSRPAAYARFKAEEAPGIIALMNANITRSVIILGDGPSQHHDGRWMTKVEFIYREPGTANRDEARRERWDIHMEVDEVAGFRDLNPTTTYAFPATMFGFFVSWLGKTASQ